MTQPSESWEEEFDKLGISKEYYRSPEKKDYIELAYIDDVKSFIPTHFIHKAEVEKMIEGMKKDVVDDEADPFFSEPRAYNQALSDILAKLKQ